MPLAPFGARPLSVLVLVSHSWSLAPVYRSLVLSSSFDLHVLLVVGRYFYEITIRDGCANHPSSPLFTTGLAFPRARSNREFFVSQLSLPLLLSVRSSDSSSLADRGSVVKSVVATYSSFELNYFFLSQ